MVSGSSYAGETWKIRHIGAAADGVMTLVLSNAEKARARKINVGGRPARRLPNAQKTIENAHRVFWVEFPTGAIRRGEGRAGHHGLYQGAWLVEDAGSSKSVLPKRRLIPRSARRSGGS